MGMDMNNLTPFGMHNAMNSMKAFGGDSYMS